MLFIFNLDWNHFSIAQQVVEANQYMKEMTEKLGAARKVIFNCASLGAGERLLPFGDDKEQMPQDILDYLRNQHHQVIEGLRKNPRFNANRDMSEMLATLKGNGHQLAAVLPSRTQNLEKLLEDTRARDFFDDSVYGYDRRPRDLLGNFTLAALYATAIQDQDMDYEETLIVADSPEAVADARPLQTKAVVGYVDPYTPWDEQDVLIGELQEAGVNYMAVGGHTVSVLPWYISGQAEKMSKAVTLKAMGRDFH